VIASPSSAPAPWELRPTEPLSSAPTKVQEAVAAFDLPVSQWGTVLSFVLGDVVGLLSVLGTTFLLAGALGMSDATLVYECAVGVLGGGLLVYALAGLYQRRFTHPALEMQRIGALTLLTGMVAGGVLLVYTGAGLPAGLFAVGGAVGAVVMPVCRALFRILFARASWWGFPAVIVSEGGSGAAILNTLERWPEIGVRPVALLRETHAAEEVPVPLHGRPEMAPYLARHFDIPYAILALPSLGHAGRANLLARYSKFFSHVFVVADPAGAPALWTTGRSGDGLFGYGVRNVALRPGARLVKRTGDVLAAALGTLLLAPVFAVIALFIRMGSTGAVFYRQERMGAQGRIITILKFRTMYEDADQKLAEILEADPERRREYERYHKLKDDPRVTRIGKFLRRYSLDELPQILNVLRGDMSLVGPRAYMPSELAKMEGLARPVLQSPPGMTGLWQVSGRNHLSFADRVNLDVHYIQNWSPWLDLYLLVRTGPVVLSGEGAA
jgi:Undecaprenyl-phosphate galactose phosphotransferase WbaP